MNSCQTGNCLATSPRSFKTLSAETFPASKPCQIENERFRRNYLKKRKLVNPNRPKNRFLKISQTARLSQTEKLYQPAKISTRKICQNLKMFQVATNIGSN